MKKLYTLVFFLTTSIMLGQSNYLVENFDYTAGTALSANGWYDHSVSTTPNDITVNTSGLSWSTTSYIGSGVGNAALVDNNGSDVNKPLAGNLSTNSVYASFLLSVNTAVTTSNDEFFFHFLKYTVPTPPNPIDYTNEDSAFRARTYVIPGSSALKYKLGLQFNSGTAPTTGSGDLNLNQTYLVVAKYTFIDGIDNDTVSLFVFADGDNISTEPTTPTIGPITGTSTDIEMIQGVALRQFHSTQNQIVDGIYVRNTWDLTSAGTALSTNNFALSQISLYPNPVVSVLNVNINSNLINQPYAIIDGLGRVVLNGKLNEVKSTINVAQLSKGIYYIKLSDNKSSKFIKE